MNFWALALYTRFVSITCINTKRERKSHLKKNKVSVRMSLMILPESILISFLTLFQKPIIYKSNRNSIYLSCQWIEKKSRSNRIIHPLSLLHLSIQSWLILNLNWFAVPFLLTPCFKKSIYFFHTFSIWSLQPSVVRIAPSEVFLLTSSKISWDWSLEPGHQSLPFLQSEEIGMLTFRILCISVRDLSPGVWWLPE